LLFVIPNAAMAEPKLDDGALADMEKHFAEACFTQNAVRATPSGIYQGRDAIRRSFQEALKPGLHDYSVERVISRAEAGFVFNAGTWQAKLGDQPFHG